MAHGLQLAHFIVFFEAYLLWKAKIKGLGNLPRSFISSCSLPTVDDYLPTSYGTGNNMHVPRYLQSTASATENSTSATMFPFRGAFFAKMKFPHNRSKGQRSNNCRRTPKRLLFGCHSRRAKPSGIDILHYSNTIAEFTFRGRFLSNSKITVYAGSILIPSRLFRVLFEAGSKMWGYG